MAFTFNREPQALAKPGTDAYGLPLNDFKASSEYVA